MAECKTYICAGFYPVTAHNLMHAAFLFAIWMARRKFGPQAACTRLDLQAESAQGATFEVALTNTNGGSLRELHRFTVLVYRERQY